MNKRIDCIDGWRAIAALGVLYGHILGILKTPAFYICGIDILRVFSLWGYGVHLFFVISGFCLFSVFESKNDTSFSYAIQFWKRRWIRIAPAFYLSCTVFGLLKYKSLTARFFLAIAANFLFIQPYIRHTQINAIYWSLSVEWIFYLLLPLIFLCIKKSNLYLVISFILFIGLVLNLLHFKQNPHQVSSWQYKFFANFEHFAWGILIAYFFKHNLLNIKIITGKIGFVIGLALAYFGKIIFTAAFVSKAGYWGFLFEGIGPLIMTFGFSWLILNSLKNPFISKIIGNRVFVFIGRISYSFYLWHTLVLGLVYNTFVSYFPSNIYGVMFLMAIILSLLLPVSLVSYNLLEAFYFNKNNS